MKETVFLIMGVLLSLSCAVSGRFFLRAGRREEYGKAFLLKGLTGLCFVVLGALNFVLCTDRIFGVRVLCGLCLGLLGDQLLALRFVYREKHDQFFSLGAAVFAVGHGLYLAALFGHDKGVLPAALPFLAAGLLASWLYQRAKKTDAGNLQLPACLYIALVVLASGVLMALVAFGGEEKLLRLTLLLFAAGGICFSVSDNLLCAYCFGSARSNAVDRAVHVSYYAAQLFIAWSLRFL